MNFGRISLQHLLIVLIFSIVTTTSLAADVDLELSVEKSPQGLTPPGTGGTLIFRITNHGPNIAVNYVSGGIAGIGSNIMPIHDPYNEQLPLLLRGTDQNDCLVQLDFAENIPPKPIDFFWTIALIKPIAPGETRICNAEYIVNDVSRIDSYFFDFSWGVWTVTETDINPDNNTASNRYFFASQAPRDIPTLSVLGYFMLIIVLSILAMYRKVF